MAIQRIAAFTKDGTGGNPAGVMIADIHPPVADMQRIAAEIGYSETAFAMPALGSAPDAAWRVRYFSPESEVPFCGHATIALGAALARAHGAGRYALVLNGANITVEAVADGGGFAVTLQSPPTRSAPADPALIAEALALFGYADHDLDPRLPPHRANAGAAHLVIALRTRARLADMAYDLDAGRRFMQAHGLVTVAFVVADTARHFHVRNAFASGGVMEDPATGAAAAALAGLLRDTGWPHGGQITIWQGEDMGALSELVATLSDAPGSSVAVSGRAAWIVDT